MTSHPKDLSDELIEVMASSKEDLPPSASAASVGQQRDPKEDEPPLHEGAVSGTGRAHPQGGTGYFPDDGYHRWISGRDGGRFRGDTGGCAEVRYDSAFTFIYSKRTGTPAAAMENQVPEEVVKERFDRLLAEVQAISAQVCGRDVHTVQEVLVEEPDSHVEGLVTGRMSNNTIVHFPGGKELIGKIVKVYLEESKGFYYMGSLVD